MKKTILTTLVTLAFLFNYFVLYAAESASLVFSPTTSLSGFQYSAGSGPSAEQSFKVSGTNLTGNLIVTAPVNFEISPLSGSSFVSMSNITIAHSGGVVSELTLYVRLKAGLTANTYTGNLSIASNGAQTQLIALSGNVLNPPTITTSVTSISGLYSFYDLGQSVEKTLLVSGTDLKGNITITSNSSFEISRTPGYGFSSSPITLTQTSPGVVASTVIYVRLNPYTYPTYDYSGSLTVATSGATSKVVSLSGRSSYKPVISTSTTALSAFNYYSGTGPSAQQSFTVSGTYLTDPVVITAPSNYEISTYSGSSFYAQSTITLNASYYNLYSTTIYVRLKSGLSAGTYTGSLTCSTLNGTTKNINLSGSVTSQPVVNLSTTSLTGFKYNVGTGPSADKVFTVSGSSLSSIIFIYAPTNYEISTSGGTSFAGSGSIILPQTGGNVATTNIYVRLKAGLAEGIYNESLTVTSASTANQTVALSGSVVNPNGLTVSETALSGMDYLAGNGPSTEKLFTVEGAGISSIVIITVPNNFELSTSSGNLFEASQQLILQPLSGVIYTKTIFVRLKSGLTAGAYSGNISVSTAGYPTKTVAVSGTVNSPVVLIKDQAYYEPRNNGAIKLSNNWLFANSLGNYNYVPDILGSTGMVRAMAVKNGKMIFCSRSSTGQIVNVDGKTGYRSVVNLASNVFKYTVRNYTNTADSLISALYPCNDIKVDKGGNVLVSNIITNSSGRYQIWKVNPETGTGTVIIDQSDLSLLFPGSTIRFDSFNVLGDVNTNATIMAVSSSLSNYRELYKWKITNGVAASPTMTKIDIASEPVFGTYATVFPVDEETIYVDADKIMPLKYNLNTGNYDLLSNYPTIVVDTVTSPMYSSKINLSVNGVTEFMVDNDKYLIVAATNYLSLSMTPPATFRIYKYYANSDKFVDLQCLWTFPMNGFGSAGSPTRIAHSAVEVIGKKATIYIYYPENGYGVYELTADTGTNTGIVNDNNDHIVKIIGNEIVANEVLSEMSIYSVTGQLLHSSRNVSSIQKPGVSGIYIVKTKTTSGLVQSQKISLK